MMREISEDGAPQRGQNIVNNMTPYEPEDSVNNFILCLYTKKNFKVYSFMLSLLPWVYYLLPIKFLLN